jgi:protein required for attachment to host cells
MKTTWVVVAHRAGARILEHRVPGKGLSLVTQVEHQAGRLRNSEINTDRAGRAFQRAGEGRSAMGTEESAHDRDAATFAREVADLVHTGRNENRFAQLVLVAEPRFLGLLRGALDGVTANTVSGTVSKDLAHLDVRELAPHLENVINV